MFPLDKPQTQARNKFQKHLNVLIWKSYLQRLRRWKILVAQFVFALLLCVTAVFIARPAFLTPLEAEPTPPISFQSILNSLHKNTIIGYAPNQPPYIKIMERTAELLGTEIIAARTERNLNELLYNRVNRNTIIKRVIWILWGKKVGNVYKVSIRSTEAGQMLVAENTQSSARSDKVKRNPHLQSGFLSVECAVNHALLEHTAKSNTSIKYDLSLVAMPVSPLMEEDKVRRAVSLILMCYTLALLPPVVETEILVVNETQRRFKRALRVRNVDYSAIYVGWLAFALMTALPICLISSIALIVIFRWIHLMYALLTLVSYFTIMTMLAFIMSMFHQKALISAVWTILQTLLQTFLAELIVHHGNFDDKLGVVTFLIKSLLPPLGLLHGFNQFALLRTGHESAGANSMLYTIISWILLFFIYFMFLMLLQRTIGSARAIGGQVSWKSIIFKKAKDPNQLRPIRSPSMIKKGKLQEVDELTAKAASFSRVTKNIMGNPLLTELTFDVYRGEFTSIFAERIQDRAMICVEDLLTGLTYPDSGSINVLGVELDPTRHLLTEHLMTGYCDRASILIEDLTVEEHLNFYTQICLWNEISDKVFEFSVIRHNILKHECDLENVYQERIERLSMYYRAQLCWAIAILLEPRLVILPEYSEDPTFRSVIKDKIMTYKSVMTIVSLTVSSMELQFADRVFLLDNRVLAFGGTPAYMFYRYGRDYRIRINFKSGTDNKTIKELLEKLSGFGANIRAQLGSLLILRMATNPSQQIASLTEYVEQNSNIFGVTSLYVSLPDPEEVFRRAIHESRKSHIIESESKQMRIKVALGLLAEEKNWRLTKTFCFNFMHLRVVAWKYFACYIHYRLFFIITVLSAIIAGACIGISLANMLKSFETDKYKKSSIETLTVEAKGMKTTLMIRVDNSESAMSVASAYALSHPNTSDDVLSRITYTAMLYPEKITEYLAIRAIDSPQEYVHLYAYGMDVKSVGSGDDSTLQVRVLYSPLHRDRATAPRSIARVYMALMRHYSGKLDASIEIVDDPFILDFTLLMKDTAEPPLLIQFLLVLTIAHITLVPSKEYGLIRHVQVHAMNFSPLRYWLNLAICDVILYWILVFVITFVAFCILFVYLMNSNMQYADLLAVPFMLMVYGVGCVPQAYLFSLGRNASLNSMALIITNIVFGEATLVATLFYGGVYENVLSFMALSPQFNTAYALVKLRQLILYNSECIIFKKEKLCARKILHKCCEKCGVLEECYVRKSYLSAIMTEVLATIGTAILMFTILMLWEYRLIQMVFNKILGKILLRRPPQLLKLSPGALKYSQLVKEKHIKLKKGAGIDREDRYGENLLVADLSRIKNRYYVLRSVSFGLAKGEALALSGMKRHGRLILCDVLAGYKIRNEGDLWAVSKYQQNCSPHKYARQVALSSPRDPLPDWMSVYDGLVMLAVLRGVPYHYRKHEVDSLINALDLSGQADIQICHLTPSERHRLHFAAAVIAAPPILVLNECTAYQTLTVQRSIYFIINLLRKRGHSIVHSAFSIESHMPVTNYLAIIRDGRFFDVDKMDSLQERYGNIGYTVVVHLKDEVDINEMFNKYFEQFAINDTSGVLVNMQILDENLSWATIFKKMEALKEENDRVYSYIVCTKPIDYIYQNIIADDSGPKSAADIFAFAWLQSIFGRKKTKIEPPAYKKQMLKGFVKKYSLTKLRDLPWSVIFQR